MSRKRLQLFRFLVVAGLAIVFFRIIQVQVSYSDRLGKWARNQEREVDLKGPRGQIRDREGRDLAISVETFSFFVDPSEILEEKKFAQQAGKLLQMPVSEVLNKLKQNENKHFVWLKRQVDKKIRTQFEAMKTNAIEGLGVLREYRREYPHGDLLSQVLGRVSIDGEGIDGVERDFDKSLQAGLSVVRVPRDAHGRLFYVDKNQLLSRGDAGKDVDLTIDLHLQSLVESAVDDFKKKYIADSALAIVVDPATGDILAWAQSPRVQKNKGQVRNIAATDPIEPGSVIKPLILSWGLERNIHEKTVFDIPGGQVQVLDKVFKDHAHGGKIFQHLTPEEILKYSSNVGAIKIGQRIGFKEVWELFEKLGFLEKTGVGLSGESRGILKQPREPQKVEQATMFFGQGLALTPLQITRAFNVIAGDGHLKTLRISKDAPLDVHPVKVLEPKTLGRIRTLMESALSDGGTATNARVEGYKISGKTGTAQKSNGKGGYLENSYWSTFVGFLPSDDPKFLIYAAFDNPKGNVHSGGMTAAPLFSEIARLCLRNEDPIIPENVIAENATIDDTPEPNPVLRELAQTALTESQNLPPQSEEAIVEENAINNGIIPNLVGEHLREAVEKVAGGNFDLKIRGKGHYVAHQYPEAGTYTKKNRQLVLFLK